MAERSQLRLADGRQLDVHEDGPLHGEVLVFHHGTPGSGVPIRALADPVVRRGLRFVSASRPGYGDSTRHAGRCVADVVDDTTAVLDSIGADRCVVAGWSGGGPHALVCGARLAERVSAVLVMAGVGPFDADGLDFLAGMGENNVIEFGKTLEGETALRPFLEEQRGQLLHATPQDIVSAMSTLLPPVDRAIITDEFGSDFAINLHEGLRVGVDGWIDDDLAFATPWGFELGEIAVPTFLWQGSEDLMVPIAHGRWLAERIPGVVAHLEHGEGHLSLNVGAVDRMLEELLAGV